MRDRILPRYPIRPVFRNGQGIGRGQAFSALFRQERQTQPKKEILRIAIIDDGDMLFRYSEPAVSHHATCARKVAENCNATSNIR